MHIGFRSSSGRGEYELVGTQSGYTAASLEGWPFFMRWPDGVVRDTGLWLDPGDSGKPRLRSTLKSPIQIGKIVTAMLMLPDDTRDVRKLTDGWPIVQAKRYLLRQVGFTPDSDFAELAERVTFGPSWIEVCNRSGTDVLGVEARWRRIEKVVARRTELPAEIQGSLDRYATYVASVPVIQRGLVTIIADLCRALYVAPGVPYFEDNDPLPVLESLLGIASGDQPSLPPPSDLTEDEPAISARSAHEYRLAKSRGVAGRNFGNKVRTAYRNRCAFCGAQFGGIDGVVSGVDAAHILAWAKHDLDVLSNGIALCKLHHWAFDAGIMVPYIEGGDYYVRFTVLADRVDPASLLHLGSDGDRILEEWLPENPVQRPSTVYLNRLYADLGVVFRDAS